MGQKKNAKDRPKTLVIHSAPSVASIDEKLRDSSSVVDPNRISILEHRLYYSGPDAGSEYGRRMPQKRRAVTPNPTGQKDALRHIHLQKGTQRFVDYVYIIKIGTDIGPNINLMTINRK